MHIKLTIIFLFLSISIYSQETNELNIESLESSLTLELEELELNLSSSTLKYKAFKGSAITAYSLLGIGMAFIIIDSMVQTPNETDPSKSFKDLTWSGITFSSIGTILGITFNILERKEEKVKIILETEIYDIKSELGILQLQN